MFIDIHTHITYGDCPELAARIMNRPPFDVDVLLKRMDMEGLDKSVVLPLINPEVLDRYGCAGNQEIIAACKKHPDRLIPFCSVDPRSLLVWGSREGRGCMYNLLQIYKDLGCKGIGEVCGSIPVDDDRYGVIYEAAGELNMPLILLPVGIVYICETLSVILQVGYFKLTHGKRLFKMAPIHHHFEKCGWGEIKIVFVFAGITLLFAALALFGI